MSGLARNERAESSSEDHLEVASNASAHTSATSSSTAEERIKMAKKVRKHESIPSGDSITTSESPTSHASTSAQPSPKLSTATASTSTAAPTTRRNGKRQKKPPRQATDTSLIISSTTSSGFSSAISDTSAHSTTSGTSSPYGTGSNFQRLSPTEIKYRDERAKVLRTYIVGKIVGEGSYGKVKEAIDSQTKKMVAIKILSKKTLRRVPGGEASVEREIGIIESLSHKNVISILTHFPIEAKQKFYIVFEYMGGGNLTNFLDGAPNKRLPIYQARKLFLNLLGGLEHLRERRILHRDIKPDNLLLDDHGELKIADFGVAEVVDSESVEKIRDHAGAGIGSPAFQAPELIAAPTSSAKSRAKRAANDILFKSDIWSAGIVLFIMVVGEYPFPIQAGNIMMLFEDIAAGKFTVPDWVPLDCSDLISQMLQTNPVDRIDLAGIRQHPFIKTVPPKTPSIPIPSIPSMWPSHDKPSLGSVIKKMRPQLEREQELERASRSYDDDEDYLEHSSHPSNSNSCYEDDEYDDEQVSASRRNRNGSRTSQQTSKCAIM